jgi:hypothetical protein
MYGNIGVWASASHTASITCYPKEITQLEEVLSTGDPNIDSVDGHPIAYAHHLQASQNYENPPIFLREDSEQITSKEETATKVPVWMNTAAQVATGNRRMVLEDEPDKMDSDDDDTLEDERGEVLIRMYTPGMDPKKGPVMLSQAQVPAQKAAAQMLKSLKAPPRSQSPVGGSSDEDDPSAPEFVWSQTKSCMRRNKHFRGQTATDDIKIETKAPSCNPFIPRSSTPIESAPPRPVTPVSVPLNTLPVLKKGKKSTGKRGGKKTSMTTSFQDASRAGSLRGVTGSGQTDKCVAQGNHSKT